MAASSQHRRMVAYAREFWAEGKFSSLSGSEASVNPGAELRLQVLSGMTKARRRGIIYLRSLRCLSWAGALELRVRCDSSWARCYHTAGRQAPLQFIGYLLCAKAFLYSASLPVPKLHYSAFLFVKKGNWVSGRLSNPFLMSRGKWQEPGLEWHLSDSDIWSFSMRTPLSTCEKRLETPSFRQHKLRTLGFTGVKNTSVISHLIHTTNVRWLERNSVSHKIFFQFLLKYKYSDVMQAKILS